MLPLATLALLGWSVLRRLTNLGMSRWWCLTALVPVANLWLGYRCYACPTGYAYHKKLDVAGIILAILYSITGVAASLLVAAFLFVVLSDGDKPEALVNLVKATYSYFSTRL